MLRAVNIGWLQSPSWLLSKRRSMRRLLLVSLRAIVAFTRNPSWRLVLEKVATLQTPQNAEGFRVFHAFLPPNTGGYAWLRANYKLQIVSRPAGAKGFVLLPKRLFQKPVKRPVV